MKTILVPTDFTEVSDRAERWAGEIARLHQAKLHLLHVVEPIGDPSEDDPEVSEFHRTLETRAREELSARATALGELEVRCSVVLGHRHECIAREAQSVEAWLIVMGTHPLEPPGGEPRPGTSHQLLRRIDRPILLVP